MQDYTQLEEGEYRDLFHHSDGMIHDSASFLGEYLFLDKPVMYLVATDRLKDYFNPFGCDAFDACMHGYTELDIIRFVESVILKKDINKFDRDEFRGKYPEVISVNNLSPSGIIVREIKKNL